MTGLRSAAEKVLRDNDLGEMTAAAPRLYPHMWSWDAGIITAAGLAHLSVPRAITEMHTLLRGQWKSGMIPHIVFSDQSGYFPGPQRWQAHLSALAPAEVRTSGICQPPVHALAVDAILRAGRRRGGSDRVAAEEFVAATFPSWAAWHRWLATARDPQQRGLVEIVHGWESGMDNSPRWDAPYSGVNVGQVPRFTRRDTEHVTDLAERPSDAEYARYLWLIEQMRRVGYDDRAVLRTIDFRAGDVFASALLALTSDVLATIGQEYGYRSLTAELRDIATRFRSGVAATVNPDTGMARDVDRLTGDWIEVDSIAGFAPLLCGAGDAVARQRAEFWGERWCGHPGLAYRLPPSVSPASPQVRPKTYWRGPVWPFLTWLWTWAFQYHGDTASAAALRTASLRQLSDGRFGEYYEPFTGEAIGSPWQSWTAAAALDWLVQTR